MYPWCGPLPCVRSAISRLVTWAPSMYAALPVLRLVPDDWVRSKTGSAGAATGRACCWPTFMEKTPEIWARSLSGAGAEGGGGDGGHSERDERAGEAGAGHGGSPCVRVGGGGGSSLLAPGPHEAYNRP